MNSNEAIRATYIDRYGETREIHHTRHGLKVKRNSVTPVLNLNAHVGRLTGEKIRAEREAQGMTLAQLCVAAGLSSATPKARMWEIEQGVRKEGLRFGTLFAIAFALGVEPCQLLPSVAEAAAAAGVHDSIERVVMVR
jgi:lambda repressor-like predicted transcriptional regulator